jgi:Protein of unknown function (DUF3300)/Chaperone of endosialidase
MVSWAIRTLVLAIALVVPVVAAAQQASPPAAANPPLLKPEQLDQLVAPIALYPDPLLAEVLMASAYPLDIVEAERWLQANKNLKGDGLKAALEKQDWDDSVKSLVATPSVLEMMSTKLDRTQQLGDAVVAQQPDVMDAIQRLRAKAQANNKLTSTKQQTVTVGQVEGKQVIAIEPTDPDTVYVPYYDPAVVYGAWPYPEYPPYYWEPPYYIGAGLLATGLAFGAGYALANWGGYWRGGVNWSGGGNNIIVNPPGNRPGNRPGLKPSNPIANAGNKWQPRVEHRQAAGNRGNRQQLNFRGTGGQKVLKPGAKPGGGRENRANRGEGNRPNKGAKVAHRGQTNRPSAKAKPTQRAAKPSQRAARPTQRAGGARHAAARNRGSARAAHVGARGGRPSIGGGGMRARGGGGFRGGGGGGFRGGGGRGGGRRSDIRLKHDVILLGHLDNGLGFYRFSYNGSDKAYVGVIAQEVQQVVPQAVTRGPDGYLRVNYDRLGVQFESYRQWLGSGDKIP